ncbi:unnamed protein product, partial [Rotaria sp. Silwood1]
MKTVTVTLTNLFGETSKISAEQTSFTLEHTTETSTIANTNGSSITSIENSTNVQQTESSSLISSMTPIDKITSAPMNTVSRTVLFSSATSTTTEHSRTTDHNWKTSHSQPQATTRYASEETTLSTISSIPTQTLSETSSNIMQKTETVSQTSVHLSSNSVTTPFTAENTTLLQSNTIDSSMS